MCDDKGLRQLTELELSLVSGGVIASVDDFGAVLGALSTGSFYDPEGAKIARQLAAYRATHPDDRTWYADFFNL